MKAPCPMSPVEQFQCLNVLDTLSDMFTSFPEETLSKQTVLLALNTFRDAFFDPDVIIAQQITVSEIDNRSQTNAG